MQVSKTNIELILPSTIYFLHLESINNINFTHREIDIIACIQNGRSTKRIASLLSISSRTVENHIRNIMLKLECRTQEGIIDFIERSEKFTIIKQYYLNLLLQTKFEIELKKISTLLQSNHATCLIVYKYLEKNTNLFISPLKNHLELIGIKTISESYEKFNHKTNIIKKIESYNINHVIYICPETSADEIKSRENIESTKPFSEIDFKSFSSITYMKLDQQNNYYFSVLEILAKFYPNISFEKNVIEFKKEYEKLYYPMTTKTWVNKLNSLKEDTASITLRPINQRNIKFISALLGLFLVTIGILIFNEKFYLSNKNKFLLDKKTPLSIENIKHFNAAMTLDPKAYLSWNLPPQHHKFIGRKKLLEVIHSNFHPKIYQLKNKHNQDEIKTEPITLAVNVLVGLGGVGKTQLAMEYTHNTKYPYHLKVWFSAENIEQLKQQYIEFAKFLGYKEQKVQFSMALSYIKQILLAHSDWLLVFDNVNNYDEIKDYLPDGSGNIILTTRQRNWPSSFQIVDIGVMSELESITLIKSLIKNDINNIENEQIEELVNILGYLPLALAQAGSYIQQNSITIQDYLDLYKKHETDLLLDPATPEGTNSLPVEISWNITLNAIIKDSDIKNNSLLALHLLTVCSYMAPEAIPREILLNWIKKTYPELPNPQLILAKLIGKLHSYSMISNNQNGNITIHPLVQAVLRHQHKLTIEKQNSHYPKLTQEWYDTIIESAHEEFNRQTKPFENEKRKRTLYPHLQSLVNHYDSLWLQQHKKTHIGDILCDIGDIMLEHMFNPTTAKAYYERGLTFQKQLYGEQHPQIAYVLRNLGTAYRKLGNYPKAKVLFEQAVKIQEQHYGKNHPSLSPFLTNLGFVQRLFGNFEEAKQLLERALNIEEKYNRNNHPEVAIILECLGIVDYKMEHYKEAKAKFERALKILRLHYDKNHPTIAFVLRNLGHTYAMSGNSKKAIEVLETALQIQRLYCDNSNSDIAFTLRELGYAYGLNGNYNYGINILEQGLRIQEKIYGNNHPEVAFTLKFLGIIYDKKQDHKHAKELLLRAANIQETFYGKDNIETLRVKNIIAKLQ